MLINELQKLLDVGQINPEPPYDLCMGHTAFCTFTRFCNDPQGNYLWVCILDVDEDLAGNTIYKVHDKDEKPIWILAKYFWTKGQVQDLAGDTSGSGNTYETDLVLPPTVKVKDPAALIQAVLNMMRDAKVRGRAGLTNLGPVKCDVDGLTLGHFYKIGEALGEEVCEVINDPKYKIR